MRKLVIFGTGSISDEISNFVERYDLYRVIGYTMDKDFIRDEKYNDKYIYPAEELEHHIDKTSTDLFIAISWIQKMNKYKKMKYLAMKEKGFDFANLISPKASIVTDNIGEGNWINDFVYIGYNAAIGSNNVFLTSSNLEHHTILGSHNFIGQNCSIAGSSYIGDRNYFGANSTIFNKISIGDNNIVGAGVVLKNSISERILCVASNPYTKQCTMEKIEDYIDINRMKNKGKI